MSRSLAPAGQSAFLAGHYGKSVKVDGFIYEILHDPRDRHSICGGERIQLPIR